jgi:hypothetical protein
MLVDKQGSTLFPVHRAQFFRRPSGRAFVNCAEAVAAFAARKRLAAVDHAAMITATD